MTRINGDASPVPASHRAASALAHLLHQPDNKAFYSSAETVTLLSEDNALQCPERVILERLKEWLNGRRMLDVGVGGGRTTHHFAPCVATYVGVDYAPPMIAACKAHLSGEMENVTFTVGDARDLSKFDTGAFDFVLFSYNGIDYISHDDRLAALAELRRVCAPSGFVCFSSHNLGAASQLFRLRPHQKVNTYTRVRGLVLQVIFRALNSRHRTLAQSGHAIVRDSIYQFRLATYYVHPSEQLKQLADAGFSYVELYALDGQQIEPADAGDTGGLWVYYLAACSDQSPRFL